MKILHCQEADLALISDWHTLGAALDVRANVLAWALRERHRMQRRIRLGKRTVYQSSPALLSIQTRLVTLFEPLQEALPGKEAILAYRRGASFVTSLKGMAGSSLMITGDVRGFYDHVYLGHIEATLAELGFTHTGARLVGRYCVVRNGRHQSLQQGSPASPVLSNLVGARYFDVPIRAWLKREYPNLDMTYLRYCDNLALFVRGEVPDGFAAAYKGAVRALLAEHGFATHDWRTVSDSHPKLNQKFLGLVLNKEARLDRARIDELRAILYNCCFSGFAEEGRRYLFDKGLLRGGEIEDMEAGTVRRKFRQILRGHLAYINPVNAKQGLWLQKLFAAADILDHYQTESIVTRDVVRAAVRSYRNRDESLEVYTGRVAVAAKQAEEEVEALARTLMARTA